MDAGCIITHHHGCIDKAVGSQVHQRPGKSRNQNKVGHFQINI
jgi:hypothetical protein